MLPSEQIEDVPLIIFCPADHIPDSQARIVLLGMVDKARMVNVNSTHAHTHTLRRTGDTRPYGRPPCPSEKVALDLSAAAP